MDNSEPGPSRPHRISADRARSLLESIIDDEDESSSGSDRSRSSDNEQSDESDQEIDLDLDLDDGNETDEGALPSSRGDGKSSSRPRKRRRVDNNDNQRSEWRVVGLDENNPAFTSSRFQYLPPRDRMPGLNVDLRPESTPLDCLKTILTDDVLNYLVVSINEYAEELCMKNTPARRRSIFGEWVPINRYELLKFLAVIIAFGLDPRPCIRDYWSMEEIYYNEFYHKMFGRERFEHIYHTMLHCSDKSSENKEKIEPFINMILENSNKVFYPFEDLAIDEMVIGFTGRWRYKQFNASKPKKYHIKTFGLVDSATGFVVNILTYFGKDSSYDPDVDPDGAMAVKVFQTLLKPVGIGHHLYADRYYTTHQLVRYLLDRSCSYTGTLNLNRKNFPPEIKHLRMKHMEAKHFMNEDNTIQVTAWKDKKAKKPCVIVSTNTNTRFTKTRKGKTKPQVIHSYNNMMNGCDRVDQCVGYHSNTNRKTYKWWKKLFYWVLEISINNAFVLYTLSRSEEDRGSRKKLSRKKFKLMLKDELLSAAADLAVEEGNNILQRKTPGRPRLSNPVQRFEGAKHLIHWTGKDRNCVHCSKGSGKRKRTTFICIGCSNQPYLCAKNCFEEYHTPPNK